MVFLVTLFVMTLPSNTVGPALVSACSVADSGSTAESLGSNATDQLLRPELRQLVELPRVEEAEITLLKILNWS